MKEHEKSFNEGITEDELESITGGCNACRTDRRIANAAMRILNYYQILNALGKSLPPDMTRRTISDALDEGNAAMGRVNQRHPQPPQPPHPPSLPLQSPQQQLPAIPRTPSLCIPSSTRPGSSLKDLTTFAFSPYRPFKASLRTRNNSCNRQFATPFPIAHRLERQNSSLTSVLTVAALSLMGKFSHQIQTIELYDRFANAQ